MPVEALSPAQLQAYLARIGLEGPVGADLATLDAIVRAHVQAIPFENLDVQLGRPLTTDPAAAFAKLVEARRGGWCYEHNGVLGAALSAIGFDVTRLSAGVMRQRRARVTRARSSCGRNRMKPSRRCATSPSAVVDDLDRAPRKRHHRPRVRAAEAVMPIRLVICVVPPLPPASHV